MGKQIVHDWSTGELVEYEIDVDETVIKQTDDETKTEEAPASDDAGAPSTDAG